MKEPLRLSDRHSPQSLLMFMSRIWSVTMAGVVASMGSGESRDAALRMWKVR